MHIPVLVKPKYSLLSYSQRCNKPREKNNNTENGIQSPQNDFIMWTSTASHMINLSNFIWFSLIFKFLVYRDP